MKDAMWMIVASLLVVATVIGVWLMFMPLAHAGEPCRGQIGLASFYSYTGHRTASGEAFSGAGMTAATLIFPLGSILRVTDLSTGRSITVRDNDHGPYVRGRIIDLAQAAAGRLGMGGLAKVCVERIS